MFFAWGMHQRRRLLLGLVVTALAAVLVSGCGGGGATQEEEEESAADTTTAAGGGGGEQASEADLDAALEKSFQESAAPGVVAAVQIPKYTWIETRGVADRTSEEPMTPEVHHRIGSVTKTFTISLLLQAEAEGLLSLDDTIDRYIEGVPNGDEITLRQIADMTSGVANYTEDEQWPDLQTSDPYRMWKPEEVMQLGIKDSPLFDPGTEWHYSNTNTVILGLVLEQVTGQPIGERYRERIIEPLGLQDTSFPGLADNSLPDPHAQGYTFFGQSSGGEPANATDWNPSWGWTAGAMISTVDDLLVYGRALGTGEGLLPPEQQTQRLDSFVSDLPPLNQPPLEGNLAYGLGLGNDHGWIGHNSQIAGYNTQLFYHSELDAVVAVEVNSDISSGDCPEDTPTMKDGPQGIPCAAPADRIFRALAEALGKPAPAP
jgi:D-alanyl-D-alanine carboxypeptidase